MPAQEHGGPARELVLESWALSICRLDPDAPWPQPPPGAPVHSVTRTPDELSVVCAVGYEPAGARVETGWRALRVIGPLPFELFGVVASIAGPLAGAAVGVFVVSTFDTDLVLVKSTDLDRARAALESAGLTVTVALN